MNSKKNKKIKLFEAFSGLGSQHQALKNIGYNVDIVGISDWYIDAIVSYGINHLNIIFEENIDKSEMIEFLKNYSLSLNSKTRLKILSSLTKEKLFIVYQVIKKFGELDIRNIFGKDLVNKEINLFTYSFPCQDISQQGKQKGFSKDLKNRSGLLWEVERILKEIYEIDKSKLPKILLMENVKALLNGIFKEDLNIWLNELENLGYKSNNPFIINSADLGEPQRRERVFMVSYLGDQKPKKFELKKKFKEKFIIDVFEDDMEHDIFGINREYKVVELKQKTLIKKSFLEGYSNFNAENYVYFKEGKSPTITASGAQSRIKVFHNDQIVYLNGLEHLKLQGFSKKFYENLVKYGISETKIKFLAGNSINIKVLEEIFNFYL